MRGARIMKKLEEVIAILEQKEVHGDIETAIAGIHYDSREIKNGYLFVCIQGFTFDGHQFIPQAIERGAKAVVVQKEVAVPAGITVIKVANTRKALPLLASQFYDHPSRKLGVVGVTGTNGKTTTTHLIENILRAAGKQTGLIGTVHNKIGDKILPVHRTTPESADLQDLMAQMVKEKVDYAIMEVSSHALELHRVDNCEYDVAVFTNITQDHLDFHKDIESYLASKAKLFTQLGEKIFGNTKAQEKVGIINSDDPHSHILLEKTKVKVLTYGIEKEADIKASDIEVTLKGLNLRVTTPVGELHLKLNLTGLFNVYNSLAAIGATLALQIPLNAIKEGLEGIKGVAGRFELVDEGQDFAVVVDYAHTPDSLENILKTAQSFVQGKIISVFGCGGDRDRTKRPIMGKIGTTYSDYAIITSDNPRSENPAQITNDVEAGAKEGGGAYEVLVDRREAIGKAISLAKKNDMVIIAGKGHETYQIFADKTIHFDDREVAGEFLRGQKGGKANC